MQHRRIEVGPGQCAAGDQPAVPADFARDCGIVAGDNCDRDAQLGQPTQRRLNSRDYCIHLDAGISLAGWRSPQGRETGDGQVTPRPVRAYPAAGLTGDEQGLCPQLVPRGWRTNSTTTSARSSPSWVSS
jgi:hypothetical protein